MIYKFFKDVKTIEKLKAQYKKLAFEHHPDKGGKTEDMQQINNEYDELFQRVKNVHATAGGKTYTKKEERADVPDKFREIINAIINFNCRIELCGAWLWTDNPTNNKHKLTLEEIRRLHGSEIIKTEEEQKKLNGVA